jgi:hypothetical protein
MRCKRRPVERAARRCALCIAALIVAGCRGSIEEHQGSRVPIGPVDPATDGPFTGAQPGSAPPPSTGEETPAAECTPRARPALRRLNREEYSRSLRELLGIGSSPGDLLPADASRSPEGFDNNGDYLSVSTDLTSKLLQASDAALTEGLSVSRASLLACSEAAGDSPVAPGCAAEIVARFGGRAFRRPLTRDEVDAHAKIITDAAASGLDADRSVRLGLQSILMSPHFLFEIVGGDTQAVHELDDHELATRLARFLRRGLPDQELLDLADRGELRTPDVLRAQVARLLQTDGAVFAASFASQWLRTHEVLTKDVPPTVIADFDGELRQAMKRETDALFEHLVAADLHPLEALTADYSFLDARMAEHYGVPGVTSAAARRVNMAGTHRIGVLSHASVMTSTSHSAKTSPIARGHFVLSRILCSPPPQPPPDIPTLDEQRDAFGQDLTTRQILEQHRRLPACAACHAQMDPIGLAFEVFDAIGRHRSADENGNPIDSAGELPGAGAFAGHEELVALLSTSRRGEVLRCMTGMLMTFAVGRSMGPHDQCAIDAIAGGVRDEHGISELVTSIVLSELFRTQPGESAQGGP